MQGQVLELGGGALVGMSLRGVSLFVSLFRPSFVFYPEIWGA